MNKQTKRRIRLENPENKLMVARAENGWGGLGDTGFQVRREEVKGMHGIRNTVSDTVVACGDAW